MTAKEIAQLIESPEKCSAEDFKEIVQLADKYPFAQTFPILILQHLGKTKSMDFEEQLNKHAFKISDRTQLYFLINEGKDQVIEEKEPVVEELEPTLVEKETEEPPLTLVPEEIEEPIAEVIEPTVIAEIIPEPEEIFIRPEVEIDPQEDMKDVAFVQVEEMTFEPVTIDFDAEIDVDVDLDPDLDLDTDLDLDEEVVEVTEAAEVPALEEVNDEVEAEVVEEVVSESIDFVDHQHETEDTSKHDEHAEKAPAVEDLDAEIDIDEDIDADLDADIDINLDLDLDLDLDLAVEVNEDGIEFKPMESFDPTAEILDPEIETSEEQALPSSFEEESKSISLDILAEEDAEMDEVTSHAIAAGYQVSEIEEEEEIVEPEIAVETEAEAIVQEFEDKIAADKRSFTDWLKVSATTNSPEYQVKQQRAGEIMDRFIKDDPKIKRISKADEPEKKAAEFFKVSTIAKESLNEDVMPVSETLARIYEDQGNFGKAIDAYNQLLLLNPEKKSFFANQIKKLKKRIKN